MFADSPPWSKLGVREEGERGREREREGREREGGGESEGV